MSIHRLRARRYPRLLCNCKKEQFGYRPNYTVCQPQDWIYSKILYIVNSFQICIATVYLDVRLEFHFKCCVNTFTIYCNYQSSEGWYHTILTYSFLCKHRHLRWSETDPAKLWAGVEDFIKIMNNKTVISNHFTGLEWFTHLYEKLLYLIFRLIFWSSPDYKHTL